MKHLILFVGFIFGVNSYGHLDKLCTDVNNKDACNNIERNETYECAENIVSMTDCLLNIDKGLHQFSILEPEQAFLGAKLVSDNVVVVAEVKDQAPYQTVVIVRHSYTLENLRGKRFCHPGFKHDELITRYVLQQFEESIIKLNQTYCNLHENSTILETQISTLSSFFGSSCRPGPWTDDDEALDKLLKSKYSNLCELCGPSKCDVNYQEPFTDALTCLAQNGGDVAVTSLRSALAFFNNTDNINNFAYMCPDGTTRDPRSGNCTWTSQLNRIIVTEKTVTNDPKSYLTYHLPNHLEGFSVQALGSKVLLTESLEALLGLSKTDMITFINPVPLQQYVSARRQIPSAETSTVCGKTVKWCTIDEKEQKKCLWLQQAALNTGLQPVIKCVQSVYNETVSCLNDIASGKADITFSDISYGYTALKKGLTAAAYPETSTKSLASVVIVVRNDSTNIKNLSDLKGKGACFPQYGGREWLAFIDTMVSKNIMSDSCDYSTLFYDFVGSSCVPGAKDPDYNQNAKEVDKLCDKCIPTVNTISAKYCNADSINKYYGTDGALKCLANKGGDYAVITLKDVKEFEANSEQFRVLAVNGSLAQYPGFGVNTGAALTIITSGELVIKNSSENKDNIIELLKGIEMEFGRNLKKTFKVFEKFDNVPDLLFPDSTRGLSFDETDAGKYVENFIALLKNSEKCMVQPNLGNILFPSTVLMGLLTFMMLM